MMKDLADYFSAEKQESLLFIAAGLVAIGVAIWLWSNGHRLRYMAIPLVSIALVHQVVGTTDYLRTDSQVQALAAQSQTVPAQFKQDELSRMDTVMKNFKTYKAIEIAVLIVGVCLIVFLQRFDAAAGVGAGLVLQAAFTLALDMFAEARGQDYIRALTEFAT